MAEATITIQVNMPRETTVRQLIEIKDPGAMERTIRRLLDRLNPHLAR